LQVGGQIEQVIVEAARLAADRAAEELAPIGIEHIA
jgi:hypothetical protein